MFRFLKSKQNNKQTCKQKLIFLPDVFFAVHDGDDDDDDDDDGRMTNKSQKAS